MKFGVVNKSTILNRFVLHTLQRNFTHSAVITRKTNIKLVILKGGNWKRAKAFVSKLAEVQLSGFFFRCCKIFIGKRLRYASKQYTSQITSSIRP